MTPWWKAVWPGDEDGLDPRAHDAVAVEEGQGPGALERPQPGREVARPVAFDGLEGLLPLPPLDGVPRPREGGRPALLPRPDGVPAAVVEVEVGVDDDVDVARPDPDLLEEAEEAGLAPDAVEIGVAAVDVGADAGLDEDRRPRAPDEVAAEGQGDAVLPVRRGPTLPEGAGDDAEHGPAVDEERPVQEPEDLELADGRPLRRLPGHRRSFPRGYSRSCRDVAASRISPVSMRMASSGQASTQKPQKQQRLRSMTKVAGYLLDLGVVASRPPR